MNPDTSLANHRLQRRSRLGALACRIVGGAIPALLLATWVIGDAPVAALSRLGQPPDHMLSTTQLVLATALSLLPALALARALFGIAGCFDCFARGDWFGPGQPRALAVAGRWLLISGVLALMVPTLLGLVLTLNAAPGAHVLAVSISSNGILAILFGTLLWALGQIWAVAHSIATENAQFV